ncbi:hypothetical protein [Streptomyces virginiae]|uniref:hypothetical protein n=1 Tax=Streptomyces virginiae TaxID=1961 RepID=UPI00341F9F8C
MDSTLVEVVRPAYQEGCELGDITRPLGDPDAVYLGQALAKRDMTTTTDNYEDGRLIGLHLDNWDKLAYADKHTGRRRLCLNLGPGVRYIILGAIDAQAVCRAVHPDYHADRYPHTQDYRDYVASGRPIRIIRIRLAPGGRLCGSHRVPAARRFNRGPGPALSRRILARALAPRHPALPHLTSRADAFRGTQD